MANKKQTSLLLTTCFWLPRGLAILLLLFFGVFALDVFSEPNWPLALFMHLIPSLIFILLLIISWKRDQVGSALFIATGMFMMIFYHSVVIGLPAIIIGGLFWLYWQLSFRVK